MPDWTPHIRSRLASLRLSPTRENEIIEEVSQHLDDRWRELVSGGASEEEATRAALARLQDDTLGRNLAGLRQARQPPPVAPGVSTGRWLSDLGRDVRYAARLLRRQPGFAVTAVLTLALGLGSATALFAWADRLFLRPLPVREPGRVFNLGERSENGRVRMAFSYPEYLHHRRLEHVFAGLVAFEPSAPVELDAGSGAERAQASLVSANFFAVLGVNPILGRTFDSDADDAPGAPPAVVLSYAAWQRLFSGSPDVVGRTLRLNSHVFTVIGVAPRDFSGLTRGVFPSLFVPVSMLGQVRPSWTARPLADANHVWLAVSARLPAGASAEQAAEVATASARSLGGQTQTRTLTLLPGSRGRVDAVEALASSGMLFSAAAVVLLVIVCANVSALFLARVAGRQREFATRLALGASRSRLIRYSLVETLLTTLLGGALGLIWARGLAHVLGRMVPTAPVAPDVHVRTFAFVWLLMLAMTAIVGLVPALHVARGSTVGWLKNRVAATSGWRHLSWQHGLVVAQLALCLAALAVAGLCLRSGARLAAVDTGIDDSNVVLATFDASAAGYSQTSGVSFYEALRDRAAALPGVASASLTHLVPFEGRNDSRTLGVPGYTPAPGEDMNASQNWVGPDYFATVGVRVLQGREFRSTDRVGTPGVAVVNETLAQRFWPGQNPIGKSLSYAREADIQVIGLVKDHRARTPAEPPRPMIYLPYLQRYQAVLTLVVRADRDAGMYAMPIREAARSIDPALRPYNLRTLADARDRSLAGARSTSEISSVFGALCLIVSAVGLYGVLAQAVTRRTREIALRMALGASRSRTVGLVVRDAMGLVGLALVPGLVGAFAAGRLMGNMLYESAATDVPTAAAATAFLTIAALIAAWRPARWAARVDPLVALREE
jgi:macrolide transport system ATP-binding/permease protein